VGKGRYLKFLAQVQEDTLPEADNMH